jgi:ATP-binding cassette, subfamily B (MDR/TAP), member 1
MLEEDRSPQKALLLRPPPEPASISYFGLFRYATPSDKLLMLVGVVFCLLNSVCIPLIALLTGHAMDALSSPNAVQAIMPTIRNYLLVGLATFALTFVQNSCWAISGERQSFAIRKLYI